MKCPHCGNEQESGKFCDKCGLAIPRIPKKADTDVIVGKLEDGNEDEELLPGYDPNEKHKCGECGYVFTGRRCGNCGTIYRSTLV